MKNTTAIEHASEMWLLTEEEIRAVSGGRAYSTGGSENWGGSSSGMGSTNTGSTNTGSQSSGNQQNNSSGTQNNQTGLVNVAVGCNGNPGGAH
jgi:hypothetical protein